MTCWHLNKAKEKKNRNKWILETCCSHITVHTGLNVSIIFSANCLQTSWHIKKIPQSQCCWNQVSCFNLQHFCRFHSVVACLPEANCNIMHDQISFCHKQNLACNIYGRKTRHTGGGHNKPLPYHCIECCIWGWRCSVFAEIRLSAAC